MRLKGSGALEQWWSVGACFRCWALHKKCESHPRKRLCENSEDALELCEAEDFDNSSLRKFAGGEGGSR